MMMLDLIEDHLAQYAESLGKAQGAHIACEGRLVTEQLLPVPFC